MLLNSTADRHITTDFAMSETTYARPTLARFCKGTGLDIGFGGDPIVPEAICLDRAELDPLRSKLPCPWPTHIVGDAARLVWFADARLDYVYSSHVLEDFRDTATVLKEWLRVIKPGGYLVLYLPDQQRYQAHCDRRGVPPNPAHIYPQFSLKYVLALLHAMGQGTVVFNQDPCPENSYSFGLVIKKL